MQDDESKVKGDAARSPLREAADALTPADIQEFLEGKGAMGACPVCDQDEGWNLVTPNPSGDESYVPIARGGVTTEIGVPTVALACANCHFIRLHGLMPIAKWKIEK